MISTQIPWCKLSFFLFPFSCARISCIILQLKFLQSSTIIPCCQLSFSSVFLVFCFPFLLFFYFHHNSMLKLPFPLFSLFFTVFLFILQRFHCSLSTHIMWNKIQIFQHSWGQINAKDSWGVDICKRNYFPSPDPNLSIFSRPRNRRFQWRLSIITFTFS